MFDAATIQKLVAAAAGTWAAGYVAGKVAAWIRGIGSAI